MEPNFLTYKTTLFHLCTPASETYTILDFNETRREWHDRLDHVQIICISFHTDNHINTSSLIFCRPDCSSWRPHQSTESNHFYVFCIKII